MPRQRIRTIKPEFFSSLTIDKLSLAAQRTFIGLWTYADDWGRGLDDSRLIKAAIWPLRDSHTTKKIDADMADLEKLELISRYEYDGVGYFQILGWAEHQKVNRPATSRIPLPPPPEDSPRAQGAITEASVKPPTPRTDDSLGERKGTWEHGKEENPDSVSEENLKPKPWREALGAV